VRGGVGSPTSTRYKANLQYISGVRGVNLAQSTGFGPDPCGLEPKKPTLKKSPQQRSPQGQKHYKSPVGQGQPMGFHLPHEKYIIF